MPPALIVILCIAAIVGICFDVARRRRLRPLYARRCTGRSWLQGYPGASASEVRTFLKLFVDAFTLPKKSYLKFLPDDRVMDIYRLINPPQWTAADAMELECFSLELEQQYSLSLEAVWRDDITLGEVFRHTRAA